MATAHGSACSCIRPVRPGIKRGSPSDTRIGARLLQLVTGFDLSLRGGKSASSIGSIERLSDDDVALTIGSVAVCIPRDHFQHMRETLHLADERILKAGRFQEGSP